MGLARRGLGTAQDRDVVGVRRPAPSFIVRKTRAISRRVDARRRPKWLHWMAMNSNVTVRCKNGDRGRCRRRARRVGYGHSGCGGIDCPSHRGAVPPTQSRFSFSVPSHAPGFAPKPPIATPTPVSGTGTRRRAKGERTTLRKHMFNSFLSLLHPPVHLRQLSAWQASRAWKNSLQTAGLGVRYM